MRATDKSDAKAGEKVHSELGASSYYRWGASVGGCPGSVALCRGIPNVSSVHAYRGTYAHAVGAEMLDPKLVNALDRPPEFEGEDFEAIDVYVNYIEQLRAMGPSFEAVEQSIDLFDYHPKLHGTADYVAYFKETRTLYVVDYKHGAGIPVEVVGNEQGMYYAAGALVKNGFPIEKIVVVIVQPRCYHVDGPIRAWETDPFTMLDFIDHLIEDANATERSGAPLNPGGHCRFCPAQPKCPAVENQALALAKEIFAPDSYEPKKLADTLALLPRVESWCASVREFAYREANSGRVPPGWKLVPKRPSRRWIDDDKAIVTGLLAKGFDFDQIYDQSLRSPAQIEKILPKKDKDIISQWTIKESSGKNLVPENDDRGAIDVLAEAFPDL